MDVKKAFLKGNLSKHVYTTQLKVFTLEMKIKYANFKDPFMD